MQNMKKAKSRRGLTARAKRVLAVIAVLILTLSFGATALADGGRTNGSSGGAPSGGQQTPGGTGGGQQPANTNGTQNGAGQQGGTQPGDQTREAAGMNVDKIEVAIAALEDETVQASLTTLLNTYVEALEAKQAALTANETDEISDLTAAVTAAKEALETALTEAGLSLETILGTEEQANDGTGRAFGKPALDTTSIATAIAALDDTDENKATLETLLATYETALEAQSSADTSTLTEDEIAALDEAVTAAETALREALTSAGLSVNLDQPQDQAGKNGKSALDTTSIATAIAALDDTDENKATLETLLATYETALEAQSSADTSTLTEDEIAALDEAVTTAETALREALTSAGLSIAYSAQNRQEQQTGNTKNSEWQMTVISENGTSTDTAANTKLITVILNWLSSLFK
ncbi:MAG TPA: hypothetical protein VN453_08035 [Feifaniaceae bacterium]|nr:hypothetical protein [Feifaniaceae bacterium]